MKDRLERLLEKIENISSSGSEDGLLTLNDDRAKNLVFLNGGSLNNDACSGNTSCWDNGACTGNGRCSGNGSCNGGIK